ARPRLRRPPAPLPLPPPLPLSSLPPELDEISAASQGGGETPRRHHSISPCGAGGRSARADSDRGRQIRRAVGAQRPGGVRSRRPAPTFPAACKGIKGHGYNRVIQISCCCAFGASGPA
uniref:Uncharacterized protein n=1 Tax=Oryza punctata TaxID=4537 RepID=A0A0E0KS66_ORYPU